MAMPCLTPWVAAITCEVRPMTRSGAPHRWLGVALLCLAAAACARRSHSSAISADSHAPGTTLAKVAADCAAYPPGQAGVLRAYCDGSAKVLVTVNGVDHPLKGGVCSTAGGQFHLDLGVVAGPDLAGPKPDHVGLSAPAAPGAFSNAALSVTLDGKTYDLAQASGELTATGGDIQTAPGGPAIKVSFTC